MSGRREPHPERLAGFTMIELVAVIVVVGVLAAVGLPRLAGNNVFDQRGFRDQLGATLRYAQQQAIAKRREVCVAINVAAPATVSLSINPTVVAGAACNQVLLQPGSADPYVLTAPVNGVALATTAAAFRFNGLGQPVPNLPVTLTVPNLPPIVLQPETGYVDVN